MLLQLNCDSVTATVATFTPVPTLQQDAPAKTVTSIAVTASTGTFQPLEWQAGQRYTFDIRKCGQGVTL